jgi:hypothetical protein
MFDMMTQPDPPPDRRADVLTRFIAAVAQPVEGLGAQQIRERMSLARAVTAIVEGELLRLNTHLTVLAATPVVGWGIDPRRDLARHAGLRPRDADTLNRRAATVEAAPALGRLLASGDTTAAHVDAVTQALAVVGDHNREVLLTHVGDITDKAATTQRDEFDRYMRQLAREVQTDDGLECFRQQRRNTHLKIWNDRDGMVRVSGAFDPERGAVVAGRLDRSVEVMFHSGDREVPLDVAPDVAPNDHRRALALHALCARRPLRGDVALGDGALVDERPARAEVVVHVDLATLTTGLHATGVCRTLQGGDLPPETARRLACDADIIPVVLAGGSVPVDVGRSKRLATVHQRRALEAVHGTCGVDECDVPFAHCAIHHLRPWELGGPTDLDNLVPLCSRHHHAVHEGGWRAALDPTNRHLTVSRAPPPT